MATYRVQRLFSKKSNKSKVAGHAAGAAVQGAVSGALLRDALKTKSNLAGAGAVLAGTAAALHTAEAIKAARKKDKEFSAKGEAVKALRKSKKIAKESWVKSKGGREEIKKLSINPKDINTSINLKGTIGVNSAASKNNLFISANKHVDKPSRWGSKDRYYWRNYDHAQVPGWGPIPVQAKYDNQTIMKGLGSIKKR